MNFYDEQELLREMFQIKYPQPDYSINDMKKQQTLWTRTAVKKYVNFIEQNIEIFALQQQRRKQKCYLKAAERLGSPYNNYNLRKRFDSWMKKYKTIEVMLARIKRDLWVSQRNQRERAKMNMEKEATEPGHFTIKSGEFHFI